MSRTVSTQLKAHFGLDTTTIATLWKITRKDATVLGFTNCVDDIVFNSVTYKSATGFTPSDIDLKSDLGVSNLEVDGVLDSTAITEADLMAGKYDYAGVTIYMVNYKDLTMGGIVVKRGYIGEVSINRNKFMAEVRGLSQFLQQNFTQLYSPSCRAVLGDSRCTKNLTAFTFAGTVSTAPSSQIFTALALNQASGYFTGGQIVWTSGNNNGLKMEVKGFQNAQVTLSMAMPYTIQVGDTFNAIAGCDHVFSTCRDKFANVLNFRGEPYVPGQDEVFKTSGTFS